jgi:hypothetical protein
MGRRISYDPVVVRNEAAKQLRTLLQAFDIAEITAQTYAADMVHLLASMALDPNITPADLPVLEFKAARARDVLARGYGQPATKAQVTVHRAEDLAPDSKVAADIEAAKVAAEEFREIDKYLQRPFDEWPQWMQERFAQSGSPNLTITAS